MSKIKDKHESRAESPEEWATDEELTFYIRIALVSQFGYEPESDTVAEAGIAKVSVEAQPAWGSGAGIPAQTRVVDGGGNDSHSPIEGAVLAFLCDELPKSAEPIRLETIADGLGMDLEDIQRQSDPCIGLAE